MKEQTVNYNEISDEALASLAKAGDSCAEEALVIRFGRLVRACARPLFLMGGDSEDLVQEGMLGLLIAIRGYDSNHNVLFRTYAETCVRNRLLSAVKAASRNKHTPLNRYVPLDPALFDDSESGTSTRADPNQENPETLIIHREDLQERMIQINDKLSRLESQIFKLYLNGLSYAEIAAKCGRSSKSVDNAVQRIRRKITQLIDSGEFSSD